MELGSRDGQVLQEVFGIASAIGSASDLGSLLHLILQKARGLCIADAGSIFLVEKAKPAPFWQDASVVRDAHEQDHLWFAVSQNESLDPEIHSNLLKVRFPISPDRLVGWCALNAEVLNLPDVYQLDTSLPYKFDKSIDRQLGYRAVSMLTVPMSLASGEVVGVLQLINRKINSSSVIDPSTAVSFVRPFDSYEQDLIEALASLAAVCVERTRFIESQDQLIDSIINLLAGAIDAKSPYTGGHCNRVPQLAVMLAEAAEAVSDGPLSDFRFEGPDALREFRTGAWLHDCGKVTTPEYVVDKATKLEMNGNRIHEIRTRFEVLWRDAEIERLQGLLAGGDPDVLDQALKERQQTLQEQFSFVADCNLGAEFFDEAKAQALREIGAQGWMRHFDDSLGLAWEEQQRRLAHEPCSDALPLRNSCLWISLGIVCLVRKWIVTIQSMVSRWMFPIICSTMASFTTSPYPGTLTEEERYKINDHIMQTIVMLDSLLFPPGLARVPEYAGTHHEALNGKGYPRRLAADRLSVPSRIMAIADIFEALTASDRPYKKAKNLSVSLEILAGFRDRGHIDPDLFDLFLTSGVYLNYAEQFLKPDQIDSVEIKRFLSGQPR